MRLLAALTVFISVSLTSICQADYFTSYIWYRPEPEFSRIVITEETIVLEKGKLVTKPTE